MSPLRPQDFDFTLPPALIATAPAARRDHARLLLVEEEGLQHRAFHQIADLIEEQVGPRTLLVLNDTRVIPARLFAHKPATPQGQAGGRVELLLCDRQPQSRGDAHDLGQGEGGAAGALWREVWRCLYRASKPLRAGQELTLLPRADAAPGDELPSLRVEENLGGGRVQICFSGRAAGGLLGALPACGEIPLPPYIVQARKLLEGAAVDDRERRSGAAVDDRERYQTVYARAPGSVAAPTAGLHFTPELLASLRARGIDHTAVTLHVGPGTFAPLTSDDLTQHKMHAERYQISADAAAQIRAARQEGRKILAVGTTAVRTLETATPEGETSPRAGAGESALFIYPPYRFKVVDALLTNFHLPRSTLLMLVAAFAGQKRVLAAYAEAVARGYRFYSYGDAMLIPRVMEDRA